MTGRCAENVKAAGVATGFSPLASPSTVDGRANTVVKRKKGRMGGGKEIERTVMSERVVCLP